jgi:hypothetical protein
MLAVKNEVRAIGEAIPKVCRLDTLIAQTSQAANEIHGTIGRRPQPHHEAFRIMKRVLRVDDGTAIDSLDYEQRLVLGKHNKKEAELRKCLKSNQPVCAISY